VKPGNGAKPEDGGEPRKTADGADRKCWHPEDGLPDGSDKFFQGDIASHGVHLLFIADSDNARQTVPIDEIVSEQNMVMLPGDRSTPSPTPAGAPPNPADPASAVGPAYGQAFDHPLAAAVAATVTVRDARAPSVRLRLKVNHRRHRFSLRWRGSDSGGSGLRAYTLQVKKPHRHWSTVKSRTRKRSFALRARRAGRYAFRVRAVDGAGNRSRWSLRRATLRR
jgi:hypothetical protein